MRRPRLGCLAIVLGTAVFIVLIVGGVMTGSVFQAVLTPPAAAAPDAGAASQCQSLPAAASPSASASPSPAASASMPGQLCVSVQADQSSVKSGGTATYLVQIWAQGGSAPGVQVSLAGTPAGVAATFGSGCPGGGGTSTCSLGDMATAVTPASYQLQAQLTVPTSSTAGTVTLTAEASATTTPAMSVDPAAGEVLTVVHPAQSATPARTKTTPASTPSAANTVQAGSQQAAGITSQAAPPLDTSGEPTLGSVPTIPPASNTVVPAGNVASVLPIISPETVSTPDVVISTPAANIQDVPAPSSSSPEAGSFTLSIGMPAHTAETLGLIVFALGLTLMAARFIATHFGRGRQPAVQMIPPGAGRTRPPGKARQPRPPGESRFRIPHPAMHIPAAPKLRAASARFSSLLSRDAQPREERKAEHRTVREQSWRRHLESLRAPHPAAPDQAPAPDQMPDGGGGGDESNTH
jgi:hypothetical protein